MSGDRLAALADLPGVAEVVAQSRAAIDALAWPRHVGSDGPALAAASRVHGAQACAALDGVEFAVPMWWSGDAWEDSPMGHIAAGVWRGYRELPTLVDVWRSAPLQALARLHALVAKDLEPADDLGRPRRGSAEPNDPLRLGPAPSPEAVVARLGLLSTLVSNGTTAPALVEAAVVHGELMTLRPFQTSSGAIARMATRLVLTARMLDPDQLSVPEAGLVALGRPRYVAALRGYASGTPAGVAEWIGHLGSAVVAGAAAGDEILSEIRAEGVGNQGLGE